MRLSLQELEAAINWWRERQPARGNEHALSAEVKVLARVYALMIVDHVHDVELDRLDAGARQLLRQWQENKMGSGPQDQTP
ncbi:DUF3717 domain-containing protein [Massilia sp. R2A-15]|uniref:DUF3717 domain-containing protein n=1 Tax=Massilia sp. R2A-15 TaxID=3064278 RepID=UPI00273420A0|nr:DUF3717 domain-containing protein [Massilia sp. R2A-15]WLI89798.1 DUF3717 domain-containing protein [Massilia sp. R2A-15]